MSHTRSCLGPEYSQYAEVAALNPRVRFGRAVLAGLADFHTAW